MSELSVTQSLSVLSFPSGSVGLGTGAATTPVPGVNPGLSLGAGSGSASETPIFANALSASIGAASSVPTTSPAGFLSTIPGRVVASVATTFSNTSLSASPVAGSADAGSPAPFPELASEFAILNALQEGGETAAVPSPDTGLSSPASLDQASLSALTQRQSDNQAADEADFDSNGNEATGLPSAVLLTNALVLPPFGAALNSALSAAPVSFTASVSSPAPGVGAPLLPAQAPAPAQNVDSGSTPLNATPSVGTSETGTANAPAIAPTPPVGGGSTADSPVSAQAASSVTPQPQVASQVASQAQINTIPDTALQNNPVLNTLAAILPPQVRTSAGLPAGTANPAASIANQDVDSVSDLRAAPNSTRISPVTGSGAAPSFAEGLAQALDGTDGASGQSGASSASASTVGTPAGITIGGDLSGPELPVSSVSSAAQQTAQSAPGNQPLPQSVANQILPAQTLPSLTAAISRQVSGGRDGFTVQLNPSELGRVDIRLVSNEDGSTTASVRVERAETLDLFQRDLRLLERSLHQSGIRLSGDGIDLSLKDNGSGGNGNPSSFGGTSSDGGLSGGNDRHGAGSRLPDEANRELNTRLLIDDIAAVPTGEIVQTVYARFTPGRLNIEV